MVEVTREKILKVLSNVLDSELKKDIVSANLIDTLKIEGSHLYLKVRASNPAMHFRKRLKETVLFNIEKAFGKELKVDIEIEGISQEERKSQGLRKILPKVKNIIAIASGKGGVGKSTVTANLAGGLVKAGYKVGIVDADIYGPSMPTMFDLVGEKPVMIEVEGKPMISPLVSYGIKILSIGFFTDQNNAVVWRGPMAAKAMTQMFTDAYWDKLDFLLVDLPPGTGDIHLSLVQTVPLDGAVIVSTPQEVALADARRGVNMFKMNSINVPVVGIVENMSWFTPAELPENKYYIFGRDGAKNLAEGMGVPFLGHIPLVQSVREAGDSGRPAVFQGGTITAKAFEELTEKFVKEVEEHKRKEVTNAVR